MSYEDYAARVPPGKLDLELDEMYNGVEKHLGRIADAMDDWEAKLAPALDTRQREIRDIQLKFKDQPALQRFASNFFKSIDIYNIIANTASYLNNNGAGCY